jgi:hypothetical protein
MNILTFIHKNLIINLDQADNLMLTFERTINININRYNQVIEIKIKIFSNIKCIKNMIRIEIYQIVKCFLVKNITISTVNFSLKDEISIKIIN